jgi:hypothetical protein
MSSYEPLNFGGKSAVASVGDSEKQLAKEVTSIKQKLGFAVHRDPSKVAVQKGFAADEPASPIYVCIKVCFDQEKAYFYNLDNIIGKKIVD